MSTAVVPEMPTDVTEPVDPPEVVREKAGVDRVVKLQVEYRDKVRKLTRRRQRLKSEEEQTPYGQVHPDTKLGIRISTAVSRSRPVIVAAERLARYASGLIESARIPQIDKIELQLRNAELEAELIEARHLIG
jgi:hypothetical protein